MIKLSIIPLIIVNQYFFSLQTGAALSIHPITLISTSDSFPVDENGRTSLIIDQIYWVCNGEFALIQFRSKCFLLLSYLGFPVKVKYENSYVTFFPQPKITLSEYLMSFKGNELRFVGSKDQWVYPIKNFPNAFGLLKNTHMIIKKIALSPELAFNPHLLELLSEKLELEYAHFTPHKTLDVSRMNDCSIAIINPLVDSKKITELSLSLANAVQWGSTLIRIK